MQGISSGLPQTDAPVHTQLTLVWRLSLSLTWLSLRDMTLECSVWAAVMEKGGGEYNYIPGCKRITTAPQSPSSTTVCSAVTMTDPKHQSTAQPPREQTMSEIQVNIEIFRTPLVPSANEEDYPPSKLKYKNCFAHSVTSFQEGNMSRWIPWVCFINLIK